MRILEQETLPTELKGELLCFAPWDDPREHTTSDATVESLSDYDHYTDWLQSLYPAVDDHDRHES